MIMKKSGISLLLAAHWMLSACSPIDMPVNNQYKLVSYGTQKIARKPAHVSLLISQPEAVAGYQTEQMLYIKKPFELSVYAHNAWVSSPANMLYPLIVQSLQKGHYFFAVASGSYADKTDYRLDTQVLAFQQNFLVKPSVMELVAKVVLTHIEDNRVLSSRIISEHIPCSVDSPYGGVMAANVASRNFTATLSDFVVKQVTEDKGSHNK